MTVRFAALGDSITEGVGDPVAGGWRGWAALLAPSLSEEPVDLHNLAVSGTLSHDLTERQLPQALELRPHFAAVLVGGNDTLRASFDIDRTVRHLDTALRSLHATGAVLLTACLPDPGKLLRLPAPFARPLARRMRSVNAAVHALSDRYRAVHLHLAELPWQEQRFLLSADRLHPSAAGAHRIALDYHALLTNAGLRLGPPPAAESSTPPPGRTADLWWMATKGTRWVSHRCTDLLPGLVSLAASEIRHVVLRTSTVLDERSRVATAAALSRLQPICTTVPTPDAPFPPQPGRLSAKLGQLLGPQEPASPAAG